MLRGFILMKITNQKKVIMLLAMMLMTSGVIAMYPGETQVFPNDMEIENLVYTVVGNSSPVEGLNIQINSSNITITFSQDMIPDNFDIVFIEEQTKEVIKTIRTGSSKKTITKYVDKNQTVYVPKFINQTETVEIEKIIDNEIISENYYKFWHILLALIVGSVFSFIIIRKKKNGEEIIDG